MLQPCRAIGLAVVALALMPFAALAQDDPAEPAPVAEVQLCRKLSRREVLRESAIEGYVDLLTKADVAAWNAKRRADGGKLLDLAGKTWDTRGRADLALALEGLDLRGMDLSSVVFMPGTSFRDCDLTGAVFRDACLEGVTFTSVASFAARAVADVRSSSLVDADLRDVVWTWDVALERTVRRVYGDVVAGTSAEQTQARKERRRADLDRRIAELDATPSAQFAFVDLLGVRTDEDTPSLAIDDVAVTAYTKILGRLVHAATAGTLPGTLKALTDRRRQATIERPNPLAQEPALAAAIAAVDSDLVGIETWRAVSLVGVTSETPVVLAGGKHTLLVVDEERSVSQAKLLVSSCPVFAWRRGVLPTTVCSRPVIVKDQATPTGVVVGRPIFALASGLQGEGRRISPEAGTFASAVVTDVEGVESCSLEEADRRVLRQTSLREFAVSLGESDSNIGTPALRDGLPPTEALPPSVRRAIKAAVGKDAFSEMVCYKLATQRSLQQANHWYASVLCSDPHAILIVDHGWTNGGAIYAKGPVVVLESDKANFRRCVSKSWVYVRGPANRGHEVLCLGERVDQEPTDDLGEKDEPEKKQDSKKPGTDGDE